MNYKYPWYLYYFPIMLFLVILQSIMVAFTDLYIDALILGSGVAGIMFGVAGICCLLMDGFDGRAIALLLVSLTCLSVLNFIL